jgi:2-amino-4-hydroxy-6-hydroxymethyldihydropteridine diphosphokinase
MTRSIYLLLGSNLGNRRKNLSWALKRISRDAGSIITISSLYQTAAWGKTSQPDFLNQAIELEVTLSPHKLLKVCLKIEELLGRIRSEKWGPRTIDIDILFYKDLVAQSTDLILPHPEIQNRRFTLVPLNEICPDFIHPILNKPIGQLLKECEDTSVVTRVNN